MDTEENDLEESKGTKETSTFRDMVNKLPEKEDQDLYDDPVDDGQFEF